MYKLKPAEKKTGLARYGVPLFLAGWLALLAFGFLYLFRPGGPAHMIKASGKVHEQVAEIETGSLGREREDELLEATRHYVEQHPDAPAAMAQGKEFAPKEFLNEELARRHAKWRVRSVHGLVFETFDVS